MSSLRIESQTPSAQITPQSLFKDYEILFSRLAYLTEKLKDHTPTILSATCHDQPNLPTLNPSLTTSHTNRKNTLNQVGPSSSAIELKELSKISNNSEPQQVEQDGQSKAFDRYTDSNPLQGKVQQNNKYRKQMKVTITNINKLVDKLNDLSNDLSDSDIKKLNKMKKLRLNNYINIQDYLLGDDIDQIIVGGDEHDVDAVSVTNAAAHQQLLSKTAYQQQQQQQQSEISNDQADVRLIRNINDNLAPQKLQQRQDRQQQGNTGTNNKSSNEDGDADNGCCTIC